MKNNIKFLADFGYKLDVWTFFPEGFANLYNTKSFLPSGSQYHRLPRCTGPILSLGKALKSMLGCNTKAQVHPADQPIEYFSDLNPFGRALYVLFLFLFYLPIDLVRVGLSNLSRIPDLYYGINWQGAVAARILSLIFRRPLVTRFHGTTLRLERMTSLTYRLLRLDEIFALRIKADEIIMTNDGTRGDEILKYLHTNPLRTRFLLNGVDTGDLSLPSDFNIQDWRRKESLEGKQVLLMVARLAKWKRIDRGIKCVARLVKDHMLKNTVLVVVGDGPEMEALQKLAADLLIQEYVRFTGAIPHDKIAQYFSCSDVFLSLYDISNLGNPLLEAIYFATPIATISDASTKCVLEDNEHAILVKLQNIETELPSRVRDLLLDAKARDRMRARLRELRGKLLLTWEERMRIEDRVIKDLIASSPCSPARRRA